jgi:hypothetical protein
MIIQLLGSILKQIHTVLYYVIMIAYCVLILLVSVDVSDSKKLGLGMYFGGRADIWIPA